MAYEFHYRRRVHFIDTDTAGLIHFTNYFRYMEETETEFLFEVARESGIPPDDELFVTPRVKVGCEFVKPVGFGDLLDCHLWIEHKGRTSIGYVVSFRKDGEEVARGRVKFVFVTKDENGRFRSIPIPARLDKALQKAPFAESGEPE